MNNQVLVVIVTFNRKQYLLSLLERLACQTYPVKGILVVDNHGSDGTGEALKELLYTDKTEEEILHQFKWRGIDTYYYRNCVNTGGSGGFAKAFELAKGLTVDYIWAMDDDVLPEEDCLEQLLSAMDCDHKVAVPCRTDVNFRDSVCVMYNLTNPFIFRRSDRAHSVYSDQLKGSFTDAYAFPFEGPLFAIDLVRVVGVPDSDYFILYDDSDYARRCLSFTKIRYCKNATLHKCIIPPANNHVLDWKSYYSMRNCFAFDRKYGMNYAVRRWRPWFIRTAILISSVLKGNPRLTRIVKCAYLDAIRKNMGKTVEPGKLNEYIHWDDK